MASKDNEVKEIDLIEVFSHIGKGITKGILWIFKSILFLISFGIKKIYWLAIIVAVGCIVGFIFYSKTPRYFSSEMIVMPNGIASKDIIQYINDIGKLTQKGNVQALSIAMQVEDSIAERIKSIEAIPYLDINKDGIGDLVDYSANYDPMDTNIVIANDRIFLKVEVYNNSDFKSVKQGLINYFDGNEYFRKLYKLHCERLEELIAFTGNEIKKLDSLQNLDYFNNDKETSYVPGRQFMVISEQHKQMYYKEKAILVQKRQNYIQEVELASSPITVIKNFTALTSEENPKGGYIIKFGFWFGFFCYFILFIFEYKKQFIKLLN